MDYRKQFKIDHPETIGETDRVFDNASYIDWLENTLDQSLQQIKNLTIPIVSVCLKRAKKYGAHQHFLGTQDKTLVEWEDWEAKD